MTDAKPDGLYFATFGAGALLGQGALVLLRGKIGGIGHHHGAFSGAYGYDPAGNRIALDVDIRVPPATPIAAGLKAGPAGSTVRIKAEGVLAAPSTTLPVDLAGHRGEMTLSWVGDLSDATAPPPPTIGTGSGPPQVAPQSDVFPDGIYRIESGGIAYLTRTVIVLRGGKLVGVGEMGGRYFATYVFDPVRRLTTFTGHIELPPNVPLVTGGSTGPHGLTVPMTGETKFSSGRSRFSFSMAGRAIDSALVYQGSLPA